MICQFTAGLIKIVMCRKLLGPQSMHFDLKSQIKSHLTRGDSRWLPGLKIQAVDRLLWSPLGSLVLRLVSCWTGRPTSPQRPHSRFSGPAEALPVREGGNEGQYVPERSGRRLPKEPRAGLCRSTSLPARALPNLRPLSLSSPNPKVWRREGEVGRAGVAG